MMAMSPDLSGQVMMVVKITGIAKAAEPENLNVTFGAQTIDVGDKSAKKKDDIYAVREKVTDDVRSLAAWDATRSRADEFVALAQKEGWEPAIAKFNDLYGKQAKEDPNDPNVFKLDNLNGLQRISNAQLQVVATQTLGNPRRRGSLKTSGWRNTSITLYSLVAGADPPEYAHPGVQAHRSFTRSECLREWLNQ
jgi:hypothetical protein